MPAPEARDQTITEQLLVELNKIGVGPTEWLTNPQKPIAEGEPWVKPDDSPELQLFLVHGQTRSSDEDAGGLGKHNRTWEGAIVILARADTAVGRRKLIRQAAADVLRALQAAEGTFDQLTGDVGVRCGAFRFDDNPESAWFGFGVVDTTVQYEQDHSAP